VDDLQVDSWDGFAVVLIGFGEGFVIREALGNPSRTPQFSPQADDYQCPDRDDGLNRSRGRGSFVDGPRGG